MLADIGRAHPQALVYALTVASKYPSPPRRRAALSILDKMREHSATLVEQVGPQFSGALPLLKVY